MQDSETEASAARCIHLPRTMTPIFDFNEDETVAAAGGTTPRAQPQLHTVEDDNAETEIPPSSEMSVVSGITMNTAYTDAMSVGTATTSASGKSTRRRHRGAAKKRLSKAKETEERSRARVLDGWILSALQLCPIIACGIRNLVGLTIQNQRTRVIRWTILVL